MAYPSDEYTYQPHGKQGKSKTHPHPHPAKPVVIEGHAPKISVIVGGGSIGSLLASRLGTVSDIQSYVVTGWKEHADQIQASGLRTDQVEDGTNEVVNVNLIRTDSNMLQNLIDSKFCPEFIFITVKSGQNESASVTTKKLIENCQKENKTVHIVVIQNGVGMKRIGKLFEQELKQNPNLHIIYGITKMGATIVSPGVIRPTGEGTTTLFSYDNEEATQNVANLLRSAKIQVEVAPKQDIDKVIWSKLLVNAVINPLGSILGVNNGELLNHPPFQRLIKTLANEISKVASQSPHLQLSYSPESLYEQVQKVLSATKDNMNSMVADLRRDEATEFCDINGALINLVGPEKAETMMPLHQAITKIMQIMSPKSFNYLPADEKQSILGESKTAEEPEEKSEELRICRTVKEMREMRKSVSDKKLTIGFVPTMGALHSGHLALIKSAKKHCDKVVVSIFVNPTQFGAHEDLSRYPRPIENDIKLLKEVGAEFLFLPSVEEMYPQPQLVFVEPTHLHETSEGIARPGHFRGVATVVLKLFNIVQPTKAYFGQKDAVQVIAIQNMVDQLNIPVEIVCEPTLREPSGLAKSSRNVYLTKEEREKIAPIIYSALKNVEEFILEDKACLNSVAELRSVFEKNLTHPSLKIEYVSFSNFLTARNYDEDEVITPQNCQKLLISVAVKLGNTRLIDNIVVDLSECENDSKKHNSNE